MRSRVWVALAVILAGCTTTADVSAAVISTIGTIGIGEQRVLVELTGESPDSAVLPDALEATLRDENGSPVDTATGELIEVGDDFAYAFHFEIPEPETYQITVTTEDGDTAPAGLVADEDPVQVSAGDVAPSLPDGIEGPAVVVFASPRWCPSGSCSDLIAAGETAARSAAIAFVSQEVFVDVSVESESDLELDPSVEEWGIPSQPWLFIVDADGRVIAGFEGAVGEAELREAMDRLARG